MLVIRRILHPTDFSPNARSAFEIAAALARDYKAELHIIHVIPPMLVLPEGGMMVPIPYDDDSLDQERLNQLKMDDPNVTVRRTMVDGDPVTEIVKIARDDHSDLIIMGTHGRTGLNRLLTGSVAEHVMRSAPCPVLTVKTQSAGNLASNPNP